MVTYEALFTYTMVIISVSTLVVAILQVRVISILFQANRKEITPTQKPASLTE